GKHFYCVYASRRDCHSYKHSHEEILSRYGGQLVMCERMPDMMVPQMGNQMYTARLVDKAAVEEFIRFVQEIDG
ncbi:MAG: carbamoylphosphate synthase large subunit, partial [Selenomonadaceae bacterium]|nr:carbamoylphosphate synthase large subunit [Selenomonadaceae bacterium]